jgi:acetyltransferase-like isoleucine patch superfamily enzyme
MSGSPTRGRLRNRNLRLRSVNPMTSPETRRRRARALMQVLMVLLPWSIRRRACAALFRWSLHPTSHIGLSIVDADVVILAEGSRIGHFSVVRDLTLLEMGTGALIGNWNWITAARPFRRHMEASGTLRIGRESAITSRHYVDCSGGVLIGAFVTLAGVRTTVITHQINRARGIQSASPVTIGDGALISSCVKFVPGATVPQDSVVGMGAVVVGRLVEPNGLYVGVPARLVKALSQDDAYSHRTQGHVGVAGALSSSQADGRPGAR